MAHGIHQFTLVDKNDISKEGDILFTTIGDDLLDDEFAFKLEQIVEKLKNKLGFAQFNSYWCTTKYKPHIEMRRSVVAKRKITKMINLLKKNTSYV